MRIDPVTGLFKGWCGVNDDAPQKLEALGNSDRSLFLSNTAYLKLVRILRLGLPLIALGIVAILFLWPQFKAPIAPVNPTDVSVRGIARNELLNPRYESRDSKNQPFILTAKRAIQSNEDPDIVVLEDPMADLTLQSGAWVAAQAERGIYSQKAEDLLLEKTVKIYHDAGYHMTSEKIQVKREEQRVFTDVDVFVQGPAGMIKASGMDMNMDQNLLVFLGPVTATLHQKVKGL